jgi:hypothetical protein
MNQRCEVNSLGRKAKNTKNKAMKMFLRGFLQSFFIVAILLGIGVLSYQATMHFGKKPEEGVIVAYQEQPESTQISEASAEKVSKNLIYSYNEKTKEIEKLVLEIFHSEKKQLTYITIPVRTQFTMSDALYRKLVLVHPAMPQMITLFTMTRYLDKDTMFDYGVMMVEDLLGQDISYYTAIPNKIYNTIFEEQNITEEVTTADNQTENNQAEVNQTANDALDESEEAAMKEQGQAIQVEVFTEKYTDFLRTLETSEDVSTYLEELLSTVQSNLSLQDKLSYLESYCNTPYENISFDQIKGENNNSAFVIDLGLASQQLEELITE